MIRTLVVDDEDIVRRGLISTLPWERFGMRVVGDAPGGEEAIDFIGRHPVDFLLTDLTMPEMSGFELIRAVQSTYPLVQIAVLTCHQNFDFIQEALRLGAIDYIVKTQLEKDSIEPVMLRLSKRIRRELSARIAGSNAAVRHSPARGWFLTALQPDGTAIGENGPDPDQTRWLKVDADSYLLLCHDIRGEEQEYRKLSQMYHPDCWAVVALDDMQDVSQEKLIRALIRYKTDYLFYRFRQTRINRLAVRALLELCPRQEAADLAQSRWFSYEWIFDDSRFAEWTRLLEQSAFNPHRLITMLRRSIAVWKHFTTLPRECFLMVPKFRLWEDWLAWLETMRAEFSAMAEASFYSREVFIGVLKAADIMQDSLKDGLNQREIAFRVHISRGYFSPVFKAITGLPFNDFSRVLRLKQAQTLLIQEGEQPIYWIARQSGFQDEKYFSRLFRKHSGLLPSEYRQRCEVRDCEAQFPPDFR